MFGSPFRGNGFHSTVPTPCDCAFSVQIRRLALLTGYTNTAGRRICMLKAQSQSTVEWKALPTQTCLGRFLEGGASVISYTHPSTLQLAELHILVPYVFLTVVCMYNKRYIIHKRSEVREKFAVRSLDGTRFFCAFVCTMCLWYVRTVHCKNWCAKRSLFIEIVLN